jgi:hypothetical protein
LSEINCTAKLFCLLLPKCISDSYFVDKISQFRLGGNSQKSQQKPCVYTAYYNPEIGASISCAGSINYATQLYDGTLISNSLLGVGVGGKIFQPYPLFLFLSTHEEQK